MVVFYAKRGATCIYTNYLENIGRIIIQRTFLASWYMNMYDTY